MINSIIKDVLDHLGDTIGDNLSPHEGMHIEDIRDYIEKAKNLGNSLTTSQLDEYTEEYETILNDKYDQGFDFGIKEGIEETEEAVHSKIEDFTKFACEIVNYGNNTEKHYFTDKCSEAQSYNELPTSRLDIM